MFIYLGGRHPFGLLLQFLQHAVDLVGHCSDPTDQVVQFLKLDVVTLHRLPLFSLFVETPLGIGASNQAFREDELPVDEPIPVDEEVPPFPKGVEIRDKLEHSIAKWIAFGESEWDELPKQLDLVGERVAASQDHCFGRQVLACDEERGQELEVELQRGEVGRSMTDERVGMHHGVLFGITLLWFVLHLAGERHG